MTWYLQHQLARDIVAAHEREAARIRIERQVRLAEEGRAIAPSPARPAFANVRRVVAQPVVALGGALTRLGEALDPCEAAPGA